MIARGKRERSERVAPGTAIKNVPSPERATYYFGLSGLDALFVDLTRGDARASRALAPGYHISRLWRCGTKSLDLNFVLN